MNKENFIKLCFVGVVKPNGEYTTLDGKIKLDNREYIRYISRISELETLSKEEVLYLAKQYIYLQYEVDSHNTRLENQKIII